MITIPAIRDGGGALRPSEPIPMAAIAVRCDGASYAVYLPGDEIPDSDGSGAQQAKGSGSAPDTDESSFDI